MFSRTAIANLALNRLDVPPVDNIDVSPDYAAILLRSTWDVTLSMALAQHPWNFATGWWWTQAALAVNPSKKYKHAVAKPSDCVRVLEIAGEMKFAVEGGAICSDAPAPLDVRGIKFIAESGQYSPNFVDYFSARLAWVNGKQLSASEALRAAAKKDMLDLLTEARGIDGMEGSVPNPWPETWLDGRHGEPWEQ